MGPNRKRNQLLIWIIAYVLDCSVWGQVSVGNLSSSTVDDDDDIFNPPSDDFMLFASLGSGSGMGMGPNLGSGMGSGSGSGSGNFGMGSGSGIPTTEEPTEPPPPKPFSTGPIRDLIGWGKACMPDLVEILAMADVLTEAAGDFDLYITSVNDWTEEWEEKYLRYLTDPDGFSPQRLDNDQTEVANRLGVCDFSKLLYCYHTGKIKDVSETDDTVVGECKPDRYHAHKPESKIWEREMGNVNVGYPCAFELGQDSPLKPPGGNGYDCKPPSGVQLPDKEVPAECRTVERTSDLTKKLESMKEVSGGIPFTGTGLRIPLRNYLARKATAVCACPSGSLPNTRGGCVKPTQNNAAILESRVGIMQLILFGIFLRNCKSYT